MKLFSRVVVFLFFYSVFGLAAGGKTEGPATPSVSENAVGSVSYLSGDVLIDGTATKIGANVPSGSVIETKGASFCEIRFGERNIFQIRENSIISLALSEGGREADLKKGAFAAVFDKIKTVSGDGRDGFRLRAPTAVAGIRGTVFFFQVESEDSTYVCICNGKIKLEDSAAGNSFEAEADRHYATRFVRTAGGIAVEVAPLLYHGDVDMDALAAKVQVVIPWGAAYPR